VPTLGPSASCGIISLTATDGSTARQLTALTHPTDWPHEALDCGPGIARDAIENISRTATGPTRTVTGFINGLSVNRDSISAGGGLDGFPVQYADDIPVFQTRVGPNASATGLAIRKPFENLFYGADDITSSDWTYANCSATVDGTKTSFVTGGTIWAVEKSGTSDFATITHVESNYTLEPNTDYVIGVEFLLESTAKHFYLKPNASGSGLTHIHNASFDLSTLVVYDKVFAITGTNSPGTISIDDTSQANITRLNATHAIAWIKFNSYDNTIPTFQMVWDAEDAAEEGIMYIGSPFLEKGSTPNLSHLPVTVDYHPMPAPLTSARWNTLAGSTTIGQYGVGINKLGTTDFTGGTVTLSNVSVTTNAGGGYGGLDSYTLTDTSNAAFGFAQYQQIVNLSGATDKVYAILLFKAGPNTTQSRFRPQIYTTGLLQPNVYLSHFSTWSKVSSIDTDQGAVQAEVVQTPDPDWLMAVVELTNINNGDNLRWTIYPAYDGVADVGELEVCGIGLTAAGSGTRWTFSEVEDFTAEDVIEDFTGQNTRAGTIAVDYDRIDMGISLTDSWEADTEYASGDDVALDEKAYQCEYAHTSEADFPSTAWATATAYSIGDDIVQDVHVYRCLRAHTSSSFGSQLAASTSYTVGNTAVIGVSQYYCMRNYTTIATPSTWATATSYTLGDLVRNGSTNYYCMNNHTSGTFNTDLAAGEWATLDPTTEWETGEQYYEGFERTVDGKIYYCLVDHVAGTFATDLAASKWVLEWELQFQRLWTFAYEITNSPSHYLFSLNDGTANNRVEMYLQKVNGAVMAYGQIIDSAGTTISLSGEAPGEGPGRWWIAWNPSGAVMGKDGTTIDEYEGTLSPPSNPTELHLGKDSDLENPVNADLMRYFWSPVKRTASFIAGIGREELTEAELDALDAETQAAAETKKARVRSGIAQMGPSDVGVITNTGQSFARSSFGAIPVYIAYGILTTKGTWRVACFMHGASVRDASNDADFDPITDGGAGNDTLQTMVATIDAGNTVLTNEDVEANGFPSTSYVGESPIVGSCYEFAALLMDYFGQSTPLFRIVGGAVGSATDGSIAAISDTSGNPWLQYVDWHTKTYAKIGSQWGVSASNIKFLGADINHGESGYRAKNWKADYRDGGTANTGIGISGWLDNLDQIAVDIYGQDPDTEKPLHVVSIPSLNWQEDGNAICAAWRQMEAERDNVVIAFATYAGQNSGTVGAEHPTAWGAVTDGCHKARARYYVQVLGQNWFNPEIYKAWQHGNKVYIGCLAMNYPMQRLPVSGYMTPAIEDILNGGYVFWDGTKPAGVESVEVNPARPSIIEVTLKEWPSRPLRGGYAQKTGSNGRGEWFDSSPDFNRWEYEHKAYDYADRDVSDTYDYVRGASPLLPDFFECEMI
jgi:hypothetical protein